jgi:PAS domain S-box-containing protein
MVKHNPVAPNHNRPFAIRVAVLFLPIALLTCGAAFYIHYSLQEREAVSLRTREWVAIEIAQDAVDYLLQNIKDDIRRVSRNYALQKYLDAAAPKDLRYLEEYLLNLVSSHSVYDKARWIDETGMERVSVNINGGKPVLLAAKDLQYKGDRYYFDVISQMEADGIYISPLDLNIEHGRLEIPHKPTLRLASPVFDNLGRKRGFVILNYFGAALFAHFNSITAAIANHTMLLNQDGYWLKSPKPEDEWGHMLGQTQLTLGRQHPAAWQRILAEESGQFEDAEGLWTFNTVHTFNPGHEGSSQHKISGRKLFPDRERFWKIVSYLPQQALLGDRPWLNPLLGATPAVLLLQFALSWKLARLRRLKDEAVDYVLQTNRNLEQLVEERTLELQADIDARQQVEIDLLAKKNMLAESQRIAHIGSWQLDMPAGKITWSEEAYRIYGLSAESFTPDLESVYPLIHADDRETVRRWVNDCLEDKHPGALVYRVILPDGSIRYLCARGDNQVASETNSVSMVGTVQDITQHKLAETALAGSAAHNQAILDTVSDGIITFDGLGNVESINPAAEGIFGYSADEVIGRNVNMFMPGAYHSNHDNYRQRHSSDGESNAKSIGNTVEGRRKDGTRFPLDLVVGKVKFDGERLFTGVVRDITERKLAGDMLLAALNEKELLLKEVYHRVKNNLQVVSSLINLQSKHVKNQAALDVLKQSADRIKAMALLHEKLYQSKDLARIDFNDYIRSLVEHLLYSQDTQQDKIKIAIRIATVFLDVDTAIPCGLIVNELMTNALKHAFPDGRPGEIGITFKQHQGEFVLNIADNGIGLPVGLDFQKSASLGLQLVASLTAQLMGQMTLDQAKGSSFTLRFNKISFNESASAPKSPLSKES